MTLREFSQIIGMQLVIHSRRYEDLPLWYASFEGATIKNTVIASSGDGETPEEALCNYAKTIQGEVLVVGAYTDHRHEFKVPQTLEA